MNSRQPMFTRCVMLNKRSLFIAFILLWFAAAAWAEVSAYYKTSWTGGAASALDGIDGSTLTNGDIAIVYGTIDSYNVTTAYVWDSSSTATESGITNIAPDVNGTTGRWIQHQPAYCFGTTEPTITDGVVWFDTTP